MNKVRIPHRKDNYVRFSFLDRSLFHKVHIGLKESQREREILVSLRRGSNRVYDGGGISRMWGNETPDLIN